MKRIIAATIILASLTGPGFTQQNEDDPATLDRKQKKLDAEEIDKRYKSTLDKTRKDAATTRADPWSNMRGAGDAKSKR